MFLTRAKIRASLRTKLHVRNWDNLEAQEKNTTIEKVLKKAFWPPFIEYISLQTLAKITVNGAATMYYSVIAELGMTPTALSPVQSSVRLVTTRLPGHFEKLLTSNVELCIVDNGKSEPVDQ